MQKLKRHAFDREAIVASMRGHFEIAVWKLESGSRSKIFWSSPHNPLDYQTGANTYAMGFYVTGKCDGDLQIISGQLSHLPPLKVFIWLCSITNDIICKQSNK